MSQLHLIFAAKKQYYYNVIITLLANPGNDFTVEYCHHGVLSYISFFNILNNPLLIIPPAISEKVPLCEFDQSLIAEGAWKEFTDSSDTTTTGHWTDIQVTKSIITVNSADYMCKQEVSPGVYLVDTPLLSGW